jgi:integrase/recombinase XerC
MTEAAVQQLQSFFDYLKFEKRYSPHTILAYETDLSSFSTYIDGAFGDFDIPGTNHAMVRSWLATLKEQKLESRSINRKMSSLRSFFKYCLRTGYIDNSPMAKVHALKTGRKLPVFIREEDAAELISTLKISSEDWKSFNAAMLISIFYATGMRLSELILLKEQQVDFSRRQIKVLGKGNKERIIPINADTCRLIKDYIAEKNKLYEPAGERNAERILLVTEKGKKLYPKYAWILVNDYLGRATSLDKKSPHILRHSFATHLMNNGANLNAVKELLGHSSLAATQVYTHNTIGKLRDIHKKAHPKG